ncbi:MAG: nucleotidyltransferase family protein [Burkholderiales bacterium]|nr:nucleotidyltransferase family protein [Burkholderiales bacterium]
MKAMILAAGRGERMRPLTDATPKPLLEAGGRPLVAWTIERLRRAGIRDIVINVSHLAGRVRDALGDGTALGVAIRYSHEPEALETAGGIAQALPLLGAAPFVAVSGDVYCEFDFRRLAARTAGFAGAHLVLVPNPAHHRAGDFALQGERVRERDSARFTYSGIGLYHPRLFARIAPGATLRLAALLREAIARDAVSGELYRGRWRDVGTPARLAALDRALRSRRRAQGAGRAPERAAR